MQRFKRYIKLTCICFLIIALTACNVQTGVTEDNIDEKIVAKVDAYVNSFNNVCTNQRISGNVLIAKHGKIVVNKSYGMADYDKEIPFYKDTVFRLGSITKSFTALAIMQLQEKGLLNVNDPVSKYIPDQYRGDEITIHHLLTHTSGVISDNRLNYRAYITKENLINYIKSKPLYFEPGTQWHYSDFGYSLLAYIVEEASGLPYEEYLKENVFEPLKMKNTGCDLSRDEIPNFAAGYKQYGALDGSRQKYGKLEKIPRIDLSIGFGSAHIYSTVYDLYLLDRALQTEKLLSKKTMDKMVSNNTGLSIEYGYGWKSGVINDHKWEGHGGNTTGYSAGFIRFPEDDIVVILLLNVAGVFTDEIVKDIGAIALGEEYKVPEKHDEIKLNEDSLKKLEGKYKISKDDIVTIKRVNNNLEFNQNSFIKMILTPYSETEFYILGYENCIVKFNLDNSGNVTELVLERSVNKVHGKKIE